MTDKRPRQARPGGRTEQVRRAVAQAVLSLIESGRLDFELQDVARLSGVHRTTIYRRWPDRAALLAEALTEHTARLEVPRCDDWRAGLDTMARALRDFLADPVEIAMNGLIAASGHADFREMSARHWEPVLMRLQQPLDEARQRGEIPLGVDANTLVSLLLGGILTPIMFARQVPDDAYLARLVAQLVYPWGDT